MAGSLNHIVASDGTFTMDYIENLGDACEALEECFAIIFTLTGGDSAKVSAVCEKLGFPDPWDKNEDPKQPMSMKGIVLMGKDEE